MKRKLVIERHSFAPELNKVHIVDCFGKVYGSIPCHGVNSIKEARKRLFKQATHYVRQAVVETQYQNPEYTWLNQSREGVVGDFKKVIEVKNKLVARCLKDESVSVRTTTRACFC